MNRNLKKFLDNGWLEMAARWFLGLTFIYASYHKIIAPADFAKVIYGYDLFPGAVINLLAIFLPFLELIAGMALILGIYPRSAVLIINVLVIGFIVVLSVNFIRGHEFDCGCFAFEKYGKSDFHRSLILRDIGYAILGFYILLFKNIRKACILDSGA